MVHMNHKLAIANILFQVESRVGKIYASDRNFDLHIRLHDHMKHRRLNPFPGIL